MAQQQPKRTIIDYKDGHQNGPTKKFHENGKLKSVIPIRTGKWSNGGLKGLESHYSKSGTLTRQILHDGKGKSKVIFDLKKGIDNR